MLEPDQLVGGAVHHQHGHMEPRQLVARVVPDGAEPAHGEPREYFRTHVRDAREGALQYQPADRFPRRQFRRDATAQRFAESDDVRAGKPLLSQPLVRCLGIAIRAFLARPALAPPVAAIVEDEDVDAGRQQSAQSSSWWLILPPLPWQYSTANCARRRIRGRREEPAI